MFTSAPPGKYNWTIFFRGGYAALRRITLIICYILGRSACMKSKDATSMLSMLRGLCVSVNYYNELYKNGWTNRDAVWVWTPVDQRDHVLAGSPGTLSGTLGKGAILAYSSPLWSIGNILSEPKLCGRCQRQCICGPPAAISCSYRDTDVPCFL